MMRIHFKSLLLVVTAFLVACSTSYVKKTDYAPAINMPENAHPTPVKYSGLELLLPPGMNIGYEGSGRLFCGMPRYPVNRTVLSRYIDHKFIKQTFHDALESNGYDVVSSLDIAFDEEDEELRAEYSIKGKVKDLHVEMCNKIRDDGILVFSHEVGTKGELYTAIDWTVYDQLRRHVVYKTRTEGYTNRPVPNQEGLALMFQDAFEMAAHNLAADRTFYELIVEGTKPEKSGFKDRKAEAFEKRPRQYDPLEQVVLPARPLSKQPFAKHAEDWRKTAVLIQKTGHGSGFFITKQGHILTNAHVVGDARRMRLVTADKAEKLIAEVLRVDKARDVALLKLEEIPEGLDIVTLPIRAEWPQVGEDVYAIGAPRKLRIYQDTVTKGIISAHRMNMKVLGVRENYIQADVKVHPGNSGGPLLDEYGNVVGLSVLGPHTADGFGVGLSLSWFVPVGEALKRLDITLGGSDMAAAPIKITP